MQAHRRHLLRAATGGLLATAMPFGMVVRAQPTDPAAPWAAAPAAAAHPDPRIRALAWAVLAPNPHNRQPWIAELPDAAPETIVIRCDLDRRLPMTDPFDRQLVIGFGCFVELLRQAAAAHGRAAVITAFPEGEPLPRLDARPIAVVRLGPPGSAAPDPLFAHAPARRSTKAPFDMARPIPPGALAALHSAVAAPVRFGGTDDAGRVATLRDLAWAAWQIEAATPAAHQESVALMRLGTPAVAAQPDGISIFGPRFDPGVAAGEITHAAMLPGQFGYRSMVAMYQAMLAATPAFVWLTTTGDSRAEALASGRDWLRVNLAATGLGLALHPVSQALQEFPEMAAPYARARAMLGEGGTVQMLGRLGYGPAVPATPRWPVETRIRPA